ncbi:hypothetical protein EAI_07583 [Harpegnathos saltator]|uniref:Uncharacterized protein n=1 Tax=Harpegnathos saltator TaxID=610380 RepID=E2BVU8_HARSA|nr:hypothetical protein EAI_07583 [Harpegnathos saltator]
MWGFGISRTSSAGDEICFDEPTERNVTAIERLYADYRKNSQCEDCQLLQACEQSLHQVFNGCAQSAHDWSEVPTKYFLSTNRSRLPALFSVMAFD